MQGLTNKHKKNLFARIKYGISNKKSQKKEERYKKKIDKLYFNYDYNNYNAAFLKK